jgi:hypothetical protein
VFDDGVVANGQVQQHEGGSRKLGSGYLYSGLQLADNARRANMEMHLPP